MKTMKPTPMSESLAGLATRVQELETSAAAARDDNRTALEARHQQLETTIDRQIGEFETAAAKVTDRAGTWWTDTKHSMQQQLTAMRTEVKDRTTEVRDRTTEVKAEHQLDRAQRRADRAEEDAVAAIAMAAYCLNAAEWAVVDAALARVEADDLAAAS